MSKDPKNQGEGNRTAARNYNKGAREFVESTDAQEMARRARDVSEEEKAKLRKAEEEGKARAKDTEVSSKH